MAQRLNNFRVPVDSVVTFTFERKVRTSGEPEFQEDEFKEPKAEDNFESKEPSIIVEESMPSSRPSLRTRLSITFRETSESDEERSNNPSPFEEIIDEEPVNPPILPRYEDVDIPPKSDSIAVSEPDHSSLIASLQSEIENLRNELHKVVGQRDNLRDELDDLRMKMEVTIGERNEFLRQVLFSTSQCS